MAVFRYQKYKQQKKKYINLTLLKLKTCTSKDITEKVKKQPWLAGSVGASSCTSKCCRFNSWSGHIPWLLVQSQLGCIQEATDWCFSLTSMFLSLFLFPPSNINKQILRWGLKTKNKNICISLWFTQTLIGNEEKWENHGKEKITVRHIGRSQRRVQYTKSMLHISVSCVIGGQQMESKLPISQRNNRNMICHTLLCS